MQLTRLLGALFGILNTALMFPVIVEASLISNCNETLVLDPR